MKEALRVVALVLWAIGLIALYGVAAELFGDSDDRSYCPANDSLCDDGEANVPILQEDDAGWDCETMGNKVCGDTSYFPGDEPDLYEPEPDFVPRCYGLYGERRDRCELERVLEDEALSEKIETQ